MPGRQTKDPECKAEVSPDPFVLENIRHLLQIPMCHIFSLSLVTGCDLFLRPSKLSKVMHVASQ